MMLQQGNGMKGWSMGMGNVSPQMVPLIMGNGLKAAGAQELTHDLHVLHSIDPTFPFLSCPSLPWCWRKSQGQS